MILAFNLNTAMKRLVLGESWVNRRMKALRFNLINLPGRVHDLHSAPRDPLRVVFFVNRPRFTGFELESVAQGGDLCAW
jgi:hypothetical protein